MAKVGLVFSGGGGKGAYEIGVWKALREFDFDRNVQAVAGTSVGGLNAALFVQGDYDKAERLWLDIAPQKILPMNKMELAKSLATVAGSFLIPGMPAKVLLSCTRLTEGKGFFDQSGLADLIEASDACTQIAASPLPFHICALNRNQAELEYPQLNAKTPQECSLWLLATAAIPVIFDAVKIDGSSYYDGGVLPGQYSDNTPFKPLIEKHGCTHIINIYLDRNPEQIAQQRACQGVRFWNIIPTEESEGLIASLNFTPENAAKLIERGYQDVSKILKQFKSFMDDEARYMDAVFDLASSDTEFKNQIELNRHLRVASTDAADRPALSFDEIRVQLSAQLDEQERTLIDSSMDEFLAETQLTADELLEEAFTSITTLASTEGRINHQLDQGHLSRFWGGLTGSNAKLQAGINWDLNRCIYANQQMIQKLNHKQMLSMEAIAALSNKTTYLLTHVNHLGAGLNSLEQKTLTSFQLMQQGVEALAYQCDQRFIAMENRIDNLERAQLVDNWYHQAKQLAKDAPPPMRLIELTGSFYTQTGGEWNNAELLRYVNVLDEQGFNDQLLAPTSLFEPTNASLLLGRVGRNTLLPAAPFHSLLKGMQIVDEALDVATACQQIEQQLNLSMDCQRPALTLGLELLHSLRRNDCRHHAAQSHFLELLDRLVQLNQELAINPEIDTSLKFLHDKVSNFKVVVPIIGKFSGGKSTLLNRYLGHNYLKCDVTPETAFATELSYSPEEYILVNYLDDRPADRRPLTALNDQRPDPNLYFVQAFIDNPKLKNRPDLVLVDMPGFDSKNHAHTKAIACYLSRGDRFISLMPSNIPFDASVIDYLSEIKWNYGKEVVALISKASRKSPKELVQLKQKLQESLTNALGEMQTVGDIESIGQQATLGDFEHAVDSSVRCFDALLIQRYKSEIDVCLAQLSNSLGSKISYAQSDEPQLQQQLSDVEQAFEQVKEKLEQSLSQLKYNLCSTGKEQLIQRARATLSGATAQLVNAAKSHNLGPVINDLLRPVLQGGIDQLIQTELQRLETTLENITSHLQGSIQVTIHIPPQDKEAFSISSSAIAAGLSALVLGPVGILISSLLGGLFGRRDNTEERERQIEDQVRNQVIPQVTSQVIDQVDAELTRAVQKLKQQVNKAFDKEKSSHKQTIDALLQRLEADKEQHQVRLEQYQQARSEIETLQGSPARGIEHSAIAL